MKFNWGVGILIVILLFFVTVVARVIYSSQIAVDIVAEDYYHKELNYGEQIEKINNTHNLTEKIVAYTDDLYFTLSFPKIAKPENISGHVLFFCPAKINKDIEFDILLSDSCTQRFERSKFTEPRYLIRIDWSSGTQKYYQEIEVINK